MSTYYKVGMTIDVEDYHLIAKEIKEIADAFNKKPFLDTVKTIDNTYIVVYWDDVPWGTIEKQTLLKKLEHIRHTLITISEEGEICRDVEASDARGCDEEFEDLLSWHAEIYNWHGQGLSGRMRDYENERDFCGDLNVRIYSALANSVDAGKNSKDFYEKHVFNIGFLNPNIENLQGDGIANGEVTLTAKCLDELDERYTDFCKENLIPRGMVKHVEIIGTEDAEGSSVDKSVMPCVVIKHSFDNDTPVYLYTSDEEAAEGLRKLYMQYLDEEIRNNSELNESECYCAGDFAKITWADGCTTEFILSYTGRDA